MTEKINAQRRYWFLLAVESAGALIILWRGVPIYRRILLGQILESGPPPNLVLWLLTGAALIQAGYWLNGPLELKIRSRPRLLLGHIALFLGRLNLIFVSGVFATIFFVLFEDVSFSAFNSTFLFVVLFSAFCYTRELERLGRGLGA
jgi:hypothetical protein